MKKKQLPSKREIIPAAGPSTSKARVTFTDDFKRKAVARMRVEGQSATDLADELGIRRNLLYKWADKIDKQDPGKPLRSPGRPAVGHLEKPP